MPNPASLRTCLVSREKHHPDILLRFTRENLSVKPNLFKKETGRGVYVKCAKTILAKAIKTGAFAKGFRTQLKVSEGLIAEIETSFREEILRRAKVNAENAEILVKIQQVLQENAEKPQQALLFFTEKSIDAFFENETIGDKKLKALIQKYQQFISN